MTKSNREIINENLQTIEEWAMQGMSQKEMAEMLGMPYSSFRKEKAENLALLALLKHCATLKREIEEKQVKKVEESLYQRAIGYNYKEKTPVKVKREYIDEAGNKLTKEEVEVVEIEKHSPADVGAAKFFLLNKAKKAWANDPNKLDIDKENLKLKKKEIESKVFD